MILSMVALQRIFFRCGFTGLLQILFFADKKELLIPNE